MGGCQSGHGDARELAANQRYASPDDAVPVDPATLKLFMETDICHRSSTASDASEPGDFGRRFRELRLLASAKLHGIDDTVDDEAAEPANHALLQSRSVVRRNRSIERWVQNVAAASAALPHLNAADTSGPYDGPTTPRGLAVESFVVEDEPHVPRDELSPALPGVPTSDESGTDRDCAWLSATVRDSVASWEEPMELTRDALREHNERVGNAPFPF